VIKNLEVQVDRDALRYQAYPVRYPALSALGRIKAIEVELVFCGYDGYQILLRNGNVILFPREKEIALYEFVLRNRITTVHGTDPWNLITEPYLDQSYTAEETQKSLERLGELGFDPREVESIRKKVGPSLFAYNVFVWEWVSMGLLEVLHTCKVASEDFYRWVIAISKRGYQHAKPCDLMDRRHLVGMDTILWSKFESFTFSRDLWLKPLAGLEPPAKKPAPRNIWRRWFSRRTQEPKSAVAFVRPAYKDWNPVYKWVFQQYSEPHRHYHDLRHLEQVISLLNSHWAQVSTAALLAGWFHDAVYRSGASDNEEQSAQQMAARMQPLNVEPEVLTKAKALVVYTQRHLRTTDQEERWIHDADLAIFGLHHEAYAKYASDIRKEYASVPDDLFRKGRTEILQQFLSNAQQEGRFFYGLDPIFESQVETNLRWEIETLRR